VTVGLVIVTFNAEAHVQRCLEAVQRQTRLPDRIVVADSGSSDGTLATVETVRRNFAANIEVLRLGSNVGFAVANNRAVDRLHDCDLIALLNPDAFPEPTWLAAILDAAARDPEAGSFASRLMVDGRAGLVDGAGDVFHVSGLVWRHGHRQPLDRVPGALVSRPVFAACAAAAVYRREAWQQAGGFDESYFCYAEDVDLGFRLQLLGRHCSYVPQAVVAHVGSAASGEDSDFSVYHGYRNLEWTFFKNMPSRLLWWYLPLHVAIAFVELGWFLRKGRGLSLVRAKWDALFGIRRVLAARRVVQKASTTGSHALLALLDRSPLRKRFAVVR
jgi:GT2 family glycosyltransferase